MMRLLNGLHKDRIVVFINRVDQLANPMLDATVVRRAVKKRLRLEFPTLHIPVIIGSAWLGGMDNQRPSTVGDGIASTFAAHPMGSSLIPGPRRAWRACAVHTAWPRFPRPSRT